MFEVTRGDLNRSLKNYGFLCDAILSSRVRMRTNYLATKCITQDCNMSVCGECLKKACMVWSVILEPILHRKPVRGDLLLCTRWQTSAQACICC